MSPFQRDLLAINLSTLILGIAGLFAKWISLPAYLIIFGRSVSASFLMLMICYITQKININLTFKFKYRVFFSSFFMMLHWVFFYQSVQISTVSIGVISVFTFPLITAILEPFFLKKKLQPKTIFEALIILIGLYILLDFNSKHSYILEGVFFGVLGALSFALRNIISRPLLENQMSSLWIMTCNVILSAVILAPFCISQLSSISSLNILLVVIAGILVSGIGHTLFLQSMNSLSASLSSIFASLQMPYAVLASWFFLNEPITSSILIGGSIIFFVVLWEQFNVWTK